MGAFYYEAIDDSGQKTRGTLGAPNRGDALRTLTAKGLQPFVLEDREAAGEGETASKPGPRIKSLASGRSRTSSSEDPVRLRPRQVIVFTEELSDLLHAGMQLEPALRSMGDRDEASALREVIHRIRDGVREGTSFSQALRRSSDSFGELFCSLAHAGEVSGALPSILRRQAAHLKAIQEIKGRVLTSLTYPAFLIVSGIAVCLLFSTYLIPRLIEMLERSRAEIPPLALFLIGTSEFARQYGLAVLAGVALLAILLWSVLRTNRFRPHAHRLCLRLPVIGRMLQANFHVQFLETLGNLVQNGLPLLRGLQLVHGATPNLYLRGKLGIITHEVADGMNLSRSLRRSGIFPRSLTDMVRVGEQTGQMGETLERVGEKYDRELSQRITRISALIQPLIILLMAGMVGTMAYVMISVIYDTISTLRTS